MKVFEGLLAVAFLMVACAATEDVDPDTQAARDYIEVSELEEVDSIRTYSRNSWNPVSIRFATYETRNHYYLLEFARRCRQGRDSTYIAPDVRHDKDRLYAGIDTIRGCKIARIYPLSKAQYDEFLNLGETPGQRN